MALILAVEPDPAQAARLTHLVRSRLSAELILAETTEHALVAIGNRVPDLVLIPALLSPQEDAALAGALRVIAAAARVQMLTIPLLADPAAAPKQQGVLAKWRRARSGAPSTGCDPSVFGDQIAAYLAEAAAERATALADLEVVARAPSVVEAVAIEPVPAAVPDVFPALVEDATPEFQAVDAIEPEAELPAASQPWVVELAAAGRADVEPLVERAAFVVADGPANHVPANEPVASRAIDAAIELAHVEPVVIAQESVPDLDIALAPIAFDAPESLEVAASELISREPVIELAAIAPVAVSSIPTPTIDLETAPIVLAAPAIEAVPTAEQVANQPLVEFSAAERLAAEPVAPTEAAAWSEPAAIEHVFVAQDGIAPASIAFAAPEVTASELIASEPVVALEATEPITPAAPLDIEPAAIAVVVSAIDEVDTDEQVASQPLAEFSAAEPVAPTEAAVWAEPAATEDVPVALAIAPVTLVDAEPAAIHLAAAVIEESATSERIASAPVVELAGIEPALDDAAAIAVAAIVDIPAVERVMRGAAVDEPIDLAAAESTTIARDIAPAAAAKAKLPLEARALPSIDEFMTLAADPIAGDEPVADALEGPTEDHSIAARANYKADIADIDLSAEVDALLAPLLAEVERVPARTTVPPPRDAAKPPVVPPKSRTVPPKPPVVAPARPAAAARPPAAKPPAAKRPAPPVVVPPASAIEDPFFFADAASPASSAAPSTSPEKAEWIELIESLRRDVERLRAERDQLAPTASARPDEDAPMPVRSARRAAPRAPLTPAPDRSRRAKARSKQPSPVQDQWGFFDPEQCGFAALLAKLDEISAE